MKKLLLFLLLSVGTAKAAWVGSGFSGAVGNITINGIVTGTNGLNIGSNNVASNDANSSQPGTIIVGSNNVLGANYYGSAAALTNTIHPGTIWQYAPVPLLDIGSFIDGDFAGSIGPVTELWVSNIVRVAQMNGYLAAGWNVISMGQGGTNEYATTRDTNGWLQFNPALFPDGIQYVNNYVHTNGFLADGYLAYDVVYGTAPATSLATIWTDVCVMETNWNFDGFFFDKNGFSGQSLHNGPIEYLIRARMANEAIFNCQASRIVGTNYMRHGMFMGITCDAPFGGSGETEFLSEIQYEANTIGVSDIGIVGNDLASEVLAVQLCIPYSWFIGPGRSLFFDSFSVGNAGTELVMRNRLGAESIFPSRFDIGYVTQPIHSLLNREWLGLVLDPGVIPCTQVYSNNNLVAFCRPLGTKTSGTNVMWIANNSGNTSNFIVTAAMFGGSTNSPQYYTARKIFYHQDLTNFQGQFTISIPSGDSALVKIYPSGVNPGGIYNSTLPPFAGNFKPNDCIWWNSNKTGNLYLLQNDSQGSSWFAAHLFATNQATTIYDPTKTTTTMVVNYEIEPAQYQLGERVNRLPDTWTNGLDATQNFGQGIAPFVTNNPGLLAGHKAMHFSGVYTNYQYIWGTNAGQVFQGTTLASGQNLVPMTNRTGISTLNTTGLSFTTITQPYTIYLVTSFSTRADYNGFHFNAGGNCLMQSSIPNGNAAYVYLGSHEPSWTLATDHYQVVTIFANGATSYVKTNNVLAIPSASYSAADTGTMTSISFGEDTAGNQNGDFDLARFIVCTNTAANSADETNMTRYLMGWMNGTNYVGQTQQ